MEKKLIGKGKDSLVYDIGNNRVEKITKDKSEYNIALELMGKDLPYVSNYISATPIPDTNPQQYSLIKEKIEQNTSLENTLTKLEVKWEDSLLSGLDLIDYLKRYLTSPSVSLENEASIKKFFHFLKEKEKKIFKQLLEVIEYLKSIKVKNIDLHSKNFGIKNNHLALFELGKVNFAL
jgi:hypothetical protein